MASKISIDENAQRLTIYVGESDRWRGQPLYAAILEALKTHGLAGATVLRGVAGFGAHSRIHTAAILRLSEDLPLRIEVIDAAEKIDLAIELVTPMVSEGLVTVEDLRVLRYTHRELNPLPADKPVGTVMVQEVVSLSPEMSAAAAWERMLEKQIKAMPVVEESGRVVGMLTDEDILQRSGTLLKRLGFAERLDADLLRQEMESLHQSPLSVAQVMSQPAITARSDEGLGAAAARMAKYGIKRLPVVDEDGHLLGVISRLDVLRQIFAPQARKPRSQPAGDAAQRIGEIMSVDVPTVQEAADLASLVEAFVSHDYHRLIVVDVAGKAVGLVNDADVISRIQPGERAGVLKALQKRGPLPSAAVRAGELMSAGVLAAPPDTSLVKAAWFMLDTGRKWLVVVDEEGRPLGLVDRQGLLRAVTGG